MLGCCNMARHWLYRCRALLILTALPLSAATLCVDHYPPHQVITGKNQADGYAVAFVAKLMEQLEQPLELSTQATLEACLKLAKSGKVDMIMGLYKTPERARYLEFFKFSDGYSSTLFITFNGANKLTQFADLIGLRIGTLEQHYYFEQFDLHPKVRKVPSAHLGQAVLKLKRNEIDFLAVSRYQWEDVEDVLNNYMNQVYVADYQHKNEAAVFLALSKRSALIEQRAELARVIEQFYRTNVYGLKP